MSSTEGFDLSSHELFCLGFLFNFFFFMSLASLMQLVSNATLPLSTYATLGKSFGSVKLQSFLGF